MSNLLPPNSTELEQNLSSALAIGTDLPVPLRELWNPATCPAALLPWLGWSLSVDAWAGLTETQRRGVIAASAQIHRRKGTVASVKGILAAADIGATLIEWWQTSPHGIPHTFDIIVEVSDKPLTPAVSAFISAQINAVKPVRSQFALQVIGNSLAPLYIAVATAAVGDCITLYPDTTP